jgi:hypothetical protein
MNARAIRRLMEGLPNDPLSITANVTLNAAELLTGRIFLLNAATVTVKIPKANGSGTTLTFIVQTIATSQIIQTALSTDLFIGSIFIGVADATTGRIENANGSSNNILTMDGAHKGGANKGDLIEFIDVAAGIWAVFGNITGTATVTNPFTP